ncbi:ABC transporter permease [Fundidesulfovibrio terrae]|uniref:ABC transporter permease n=1 Tax=Fundidesulfovibrio terrae TaxID=2922866 RepID=UPI001FAEE333|nr:ABC transporter permease [Fundidesulfovibrio terrae]
MANKSLQSLRAAGFLPPDRGTRLLRFRDLIRISFREVLRKRRRYIGVMAAIALGTAGFITIVTMGRDLKANFNNDLDLLGGATIIAAHFDPQMYDRQEWFRSGTIAAVEQIPGVKEVTKSRLRSGATTTYQEKVYGFNLLGVDANYWSLFSFTPRLGRLFTAEDIALGNKVCVLGQDLAKTIFGSPEAAIGQMLSLDNNLYHVVGIIGGVRAADKTLMAFLPITTAQARIPNISEISSLYIRCNTWDDVAPVAAALESVIPANQSNKGLRIQVGWEPLQQVQRMFWWVSLFIYASIGATLVLGGFGIWNIMMAAVTARTREIGLKKAMGAEDSDILWQFLFEALTVTFSSAFLGVLIGRVGIEYMSRMLGSSPPEGLFFLCLSAGLAFAAVLGVGSGLYPSIRASRMQVVDAMRYE